MLTKSGRRDKIVVLICAQAEWRIIKRHYAQSILQHLPFGDWFETNVRTVSGDCTVLFFHVGWGKIAAASSTQYVIDHFGPQLLINLGTCGSVDAGLKRGSILLVDKTIVYDIYEQMGDAKEAVDFYSVAIDTKWIDGAIKGVHRETVLSADRDIMQHDIAKIRAYGAVAADWESGAIAWVAQQNRMPVLILRGVSDLVTKQEAAAYGDVSYFEDGSDMVMAKLVSYLPECLSAWLQYQESGTPIA